MAARDKINKVAELRNHMLQEYFSLVAVDNWQEELYKIAKYNVENNHFANSYKGPYDKMCDFGYENYTVNNMDDNFILTVLKYNQQVAKASSNVVKKLENIKNDRKEVGHSTYNEPEDELLMYCVEALNNIKSFIYVLYDNEKENISDEEINKFRCKYIEEVIKLKKDIIREYFKNHKLEIQVEDDINDILRAENQESVAYIKYSEYINRKDINRKPKMEEYFYFVKECSKAGITYFDSATIGACLHFGEYDDAVFYFKRYLKTNSSDREINNTLQYFNIYYNNDEKLNKLPKHIIDELCSLEQIKIVCNDEGNLKIKK